MPLPGVDRRSSSGFDSEGARSSTYRLLQGRSGTAGARAEDKDRRLRLRKRALALTVLTASFAMAAAVTVPASAVSRFDDERPAGYDIDPKHQSNWEPAVAVDPSLPNRVYQLITGINAHACKGGCPGTSVLFRRSIDGGASFGPESFVCAAACKTIGWQFDPQIRVAGDTNAACGCGTLYVVFLDQFDPGVQLHDVERPAATRGTLYVVFLDQFDPGVQLLDVERPAATRGTLYVVFLGQFDPGVLLFTSRGVA